MRYLLSICVVTISFSSGSVWAQDTNKLKMMPALENFDASKLGSTAKDMEELSKSVSDAMKAKGYGGEGCQTVCETTVTIGPDGKPVPSVSCKLVCSF